MQQMVLAHEVVGGGLIMMEFKEQTDYKQFCRMWKSDDVQLELAILDG